MLLVPQGALVATDLCATSAHHYQDLAVVTDATLDPHRKPDKLLVDQEQVLIRFRYITPGTLVMGDKYYGPDEDKPTWWRVFQLALIDMESPRNQGPVRETTITEGFYLSQVLVHTKLYVQFLNDSENAEGFVAIGRLSRINRIDGEYVMKEGTERLAVNSATWDGVRAFIKWLSCKTGQEFRLPTEAEWALAARGPEGRRYPWGNEVIPGQDYGGYKKAPELTPWLFEYEVGSHPANATPDGIRDMNGPLGEWCQDYYGVYYEDDTTNPVGPAKGEYRVIRGGQPETTWRHLGPMDVRAIELQPLYGIRLVLDPSCPNAPPDR